MKDDSFISNISSQKRVITQDTTFDKSSQKRRHVDDCDFFGLPYKVKHLFKKHKNITQLYGLLYLHIIVCKLYSDYISCFNLS